MARIVHIDPWGSSQYQDYRRLREEFGIAPFGPDEWNLYDDGTNKPHMLFRRGVVFGHRDFERVGDAIKDRDPWSVMTGLMPSGNMHLGHKMLVDQVAAHQRAGADIHIAVADFESYAARGLSLDKARDLALDQYVHNYLALGLDPDSAEVYFQTRRHAVKDLANQFALRVNLSQMQSLYGFGGETSLAHVMAPLVQAADILHVQKDALGPRPVLVPVGVDQDPHIRLTRDVAKSWRIFNTEFTKEKDLGIFVKVDDDVEAWLNRAEAAMRELGFGELKRNDRYKALYVKQARRRDRRAIDKALARLEANQGELGLLCPSATFHRFMTGLTGDKMSSSKPESSVFLTDDPGDAEKKVRRSVTGGRDTADEQREKGGTPEKCPIYELYLYHLAQDDEHLQTVHDECATGARLCGGCKGEAIGLLTEFLTEHRERRDQVEHDVERIVSEV